MGRDHRSMLLSLCAFAAIVAYQPLPAEANIFSGKVYRKAQQDCVKFLGINEFRLAQYSKFVYPPDRDTMCLIRCIGITLDFWDDTEGFNVSFVQQQFSPLVTPQFKKLLTDSIASKLELIDPLDNCSRAYYAFRTFRALLRQLVTSTTPTPVTPFQPLTAVQIVDVLVECAREQNLPAVFLTGLTKGIIPDCPEVRSLIRCAAVRTGVYTDQDGALLENLHSQLNPPGEEKSSFVLRQQLCLKRNEQPACVDQSTRAFRQFFACLRPDYERFFIANAGSVMQTPLFQQQQQQPVANESTTVQPMDTLMPLLASFR
ncbi:AGAP002191-PA-like protein [Anopheles sinensis]|uniref:AGAP002191-PA-like protein n=1 Tax=Anopheles sinensis TaxID=74873 RepID=A0A084VVT0_ANOSI|nr:AGAP002191-PA-like protein [Anopheles sinensis]